MAFNGITITAVKNFSYSKLIKNDHFEQFLYIEWVQIGLSSIKIK